MSRITTSLLVFGLLLDACYGEVPVFTTQYSVLTPELKNSVVAKVYSAENQTDAANWNQYALWWWNPGTGVPYTNVIFGPGTSSDTSYVYGIVTSGNQISKIYKRTLNNTLIEMGYSNIMPYVTTETEINHFISADSNTFKTAVAPGYLAILTWGMGSDGINNQVYLSILNGRSVMSRQITSINDISASTCTGSSNTPTTTTSFTLGNIWYDIGAGAFFYTYTKKLITTRCVWGAPGIPTATYTIYLGGHYVNGAPYWAEPGLSLNPISERNAISNLMGGGDNWTKSLKICVVYKDIVTKTIYFSWIIKAKSTTAGGFRTLISDDTTFDASTTYTPLSVWASNFTYGIAIACADQITKTYYQYLVLNFLNGPTTAINSGFSLFEGSDPNGGAISLSAWASSTGYTLVAAWTTSTPDTYSYQFGTFYDNGKVSATATLGYIIGPVSFYEDVNKDMWVGWTDIDTANSMTYSGYLAKIQREISPPYVPEYHGPPIQINYYFLG